MTARWHHAAVVALAVVALSCSGGAGRPQLAAPSTTSDAPVATVEETTTAPGPSGSTTSTSVAAAGVSTTTAPSTATPGADTTPPPTVPFVASPPTTSALALTRADIGVAYPFVLGTQCGIAGTQFDQREWRNDPPLAEPGTRPAGWNPSYEQGTMKLTSDDVAEFTSADGLRTARFVPRPPGGPDLPACP